MLMKRILPLLIALLLAVSVASAQEALPRGFDAKTGKAYAVFGSYPQGSAGQVEPLLWQVLKNDGQTALLLSDLILDVKPAHEGRGYMGFEGSSLQEWLLGQFAQTAFDQLETNAIAKAEDQLAISLPSASQLRDQSLGFLSDSDRMAKPSAYAVSRGVLVYGEHEASYWMYDKAQSAANSQRRVLDKGTLGYTTAAAQNIGVRVLLTLNLDMLPGLSGSGSLTDPYAFTPDGRPLPTPAPTPVPTPVPTQQPMGQINTDGFPHLTEEGFLPAGEQEFVFIDATNGRWRYANQDLRINIIRHVDETVPLRWLTAEIFVREGSKNFAMYPFNQDHMLEDRSLYLEKPAVIMRNHNLVFSMDGDYFIYRIGRANAEKKNLAIGVEIRGGQILVDKPASPTRNVYPPLDMMALFENGDMKVFKAAEVTAQELVDMGARDVLSFGPYLIRDGEINRTYKDYGTTLQPRAAFGMVTRGHYFAVIVEGRIRPSKGMTALQVAELMEELGCVQAFNLDGGWTSAMVFMGKQLNQLDKNGVLDNARTQNEVMGIGYTDAYLEGRAP